MDGLLDAASLEAMLREDARDQEALVPTKLLYTPDEAARCLAIGRTKLFELLGDGRLPSVLIGRARRIRAADLREFVGGAPHGDNRCVGSVGRCDVA